MIENEHSNHGGIERARQEEETVVLQSVADKTL